MSCEGCDVMLCCFPCEGVPLWHDCYTNHAHKKKKSGKLFFRPLTGGGGEVGKFGVRYPNPRVLLPLHKNTTKPNI